MIFTFFTESSFFFSQGDVCRHREHLLLPYSRPVEGDCVPEVTLPGVHRLPVQEPQAGGRTEAGTEALLGTLLPYFLAVRFIKHVEVICGRIKLLKINFLFYFLEYFLRIKYLNIDTSTGSPVSQLGSQCCSGRKPCSIW